MKIMEIIEKETKGKSYHTDQHSSVRVGEGFPLPQRFVPHRHNNIYKYKISH